MSYDYLAARQNRRGNDPILRSERASHAWATNPKLVAIRLKAAGVKRKAQLRPRPSVEDYAKAEKLAPQSIQEHEETTTQRWRRKKWGLTFEGWAKKSRERWVYIYAKEIMRQRMAAELEFDTTRHA